MTAPDTTIAGLLRTTIADRKAIVICGRSDDADAWRRLFATTAPAGNLVISLDEAAQTRSAKPVAGATAQLAWQHDALAGLDGTGWLAEQADAFDPTREAVLVLPDPLDPPRAGTRPRLGRRPAIGRLLEDKTIVDSFWDTIGVPRARSIVADLPCDIDALATAVDAGAGVVCSYQRRGSSPTAGGDGIWWWRPGEPPPAGAPNTRQYRDRIRVMPMLCGLPVRLHGLVLADRIVAFPPMEILTLLRPEQGTFLCAGTVPMAIADASLLALTERIGDGLRASCDYRGAFAADGVVTPDGFCPTDLNGRLTSALEPASSGARVGLQAANLIIREGTEPDTRELKMIVCRALGRPDQYTIYGAATELAADAPVSLGVRWHHGEPAFVDSPALDGQLTVTHGHRGWLLTAQLAVDRLPRSRTHASLAIAIFQLSDRALGTDFGPLVPNGA